MLSSYAASFWTLNRDIVELLDAAPKDDAPPDIVTAWIENVAGEAPFFEQGFNEMHVLGMDKKLERLRIAAHRGEDAKAVLSILSALYQHFQDEMEEILFLHVGRDRAPLYSEKIPFGEAVKAAFPSAYKDILEAGKCFALERNTACVMHLMRVLEVALFALATELGASTDKAGWEGVINSIRGKINDVNAQTHGPKWKKKKEFYSEAVAHLLLSKDAWRNHAMHRPEHYDTTEATEIYASVKAFMTQLAKEVRETP